MKYFLVLLFCIISSISFAQLESTDLDFPTLKQKFDSAKNKTIILTVLGVNCPPCRTHRDDIRDQIMNKCANPNIQWFVIWFEDPGHPAVRANAASQALLINDSRVTQWWYQEHQSSTPKNDSICYKLGKALWLTCSYPWDISMLFDQGSSWTGATPSIPTYCMAKTGCCNSFNIVNFKSEIDKIGRCDSASTNLVLKQSLLNKTLRIVPNPSSSQIKISINKNVIKKEITIYNLEGLEVYRTIDYNLENEFINLNIEDLTEGIYMLQLTTDKGKFNKKFIVTR